MSLIQRVVLSLICALALVLIPASNLQAQQDTAAPTQSQEDLNRQNDSVDDSLDADVDADIDADVDTDADLQDSEASEENASEDLPETAGSLPLLALIGAASLIGSRFARRN